MPMNKVNIEKYAQRMKTERCALFEGNIGDERHHRIMQKLRDDAKLMVYNKFVDGQVASMKKMYDWELKKVINREIKPKDSHKKFMKKIMKNPAVQFIQYVLDKEEEKEKKKKEHKKKITKVKKPKIPSGTLEEYTYLFNKKYLPTRERMGLEFKELEFGENYLCDNYKYGSDYEKMIFDRDEELGLIRSNVLECPKARDYEAEALFDMKIDNIEDYKAYHKKCEELINAPFIFKNVNNIPETNYPDELVHYLRMGIEGFD